MRRCLGCFEQIKDDIKTCPICGYVDGTPPEEAVHITPGSVLANRYTIGKALGYGGFGVTYIGWDQRLEQKVAIKEYLPSEFSTRIPGKTEVTVFNGVKRDQYDSGLKEFLDEAKRLSKFQKEEGIVKVLDCISENDTAYIIMMYLEGESLSDRLKKVGTIPEKEAIDILMPVMKALKSVHEEGIIHRDIAPDNIFLTKDGQVKLIDFGAARFATTAFSRSLTVIIKAGYSAEEQYRGKSDQGPHTDVYSLAATLYKMITGVTPPDALERRAKIETTRKDSLIAPRKINKDISLVTENALLNALNVRVEDRTPTVSKFIEDLTSEEPVKRIHGKISKIDFYSMPLWLKILIPTFLVIIMGIAVFIGTRSPFKTKVHVPEGYIIVPDVEGLDIESAISYLQANGFDYQTGGNEMLDYVEAGTIAYQNPDAGRIVLEGSVVTLVVSKGSGDIVLPSNGLSTVPVYIWSEEEDAIADFETAGFDVRVTYVNDENVTVGQVVRAVNEEGEAIEAGDVLAQESSVILQVSSDLHFSEGLEYEITNGVASVSGIGTCEDTDIVIPSRTPDGFIVDSIGSYAFDGCSDIESVVLPDSVTSIGYRAFADCVSLNSVELSEGLTSIGYNAFGSCNSLESISLPESLTIIKDYAFSNCASLSSVDFPQGLEVINNGAFYGCRSLVSINIPDSVGYIGNWAFADCSLLETINGIDASEWASDNGYEQILQYEG